MALAGVLEIADREFQAIQDSDESLRQVARVSVEEGRLENVEITADAVKAYLDKRLGYDFRMSFFSYEWTARLLRALGFTDFRQVDECISGYDDDRISRVLWGTRQGQISRFENVLLASMGERYVRSDFWRTSAWVSLLEQRLQKLKDAGITIGNYEPSRSPATSTSQTAAG